MEFREHLARRPYGDLIHRHTRADLLDGGALHAVPDQPAREAGIVVPVAMTRAAWEDCVAWTALDEDRAVAVVAGVLLAGCQHLADNPPPPPSASAAGPARSHPAGPSRLAVCEAALRREYRRALDEQTDGRRPRECNGVSHAALRRIMLRVIEEETPSLPVESGS